MLSPVVGFVNEKKLYKSGEVDQRIKALGMWLDYGFELGNHTFSHASLNQVGLKAWEDEIIEGETVTRLLLAQHNMKLRYFRHPYLDTGRDLLTHRQAEAFLVERGYRIAPITLDAWDWMYAPVYDHIGELLDLMQKRGYRFVTLADALSDSAYSLPDTYVGEEGTGWLDHWAITQGKPPQGAPVFPQWVIDRAKPLRQTQP